MAEALLYLQMGLLSVGRVSNFGGGVTIRTASFEPGTLVLRPVRVGERCSIGANAVLGGGCDLGDDVQVKPFTVVDNGTILRAESSSLSNADAEPDDTYAEEGRLQKQGE